MHERDRHRAPRPARRPRLLLKRLSAADGAERSSGVPPAPLQPDKLTRAGNRTSVTVCDDSCRRQPLPHPFGAPAHRTCARPPPPHRSIGFFGFFTIFFTLHLGGEGGAGGRAGDEGGYGGGGTSGGGVFFFTDLIMSAVCPPPVHDLCELCFRLFSVNTVLNLPTHPIATFVGSRLAGAHTYSLSRWRCAQKAVKPKAAYGFNISNNSPAVCDLRSAIFCSTATSYHSICRSRVLGTTLAIS